MLDNTDKLMKFALASARQGKAFVNKRSLQEVYRLAAPHFERKL